jgi:HPr kinase/phosphorylase
MATIHASCVDFGGCGLLIRGVSGAGKSRLAHMLITRARFYGVTAQLVGDDRIAIERRGDDLFASAPATIAGLLEVRGLGLVRYPFLPQKKLDLILDLRSEENIPRMPAPDDLQAEIEGVTLPLCIAASPESSLDVLLTIYGHSDGRLEQNSALASVRFDGKTVRP